MIPEPQTNTVQASNWIDQVKVAIDMCTTLEECDSVIENCLTMTGMAYKRKVMCIRSVSLCDITICITIGGTYQNRNVNHDKKE